MKQCDVGNPDSTCEGPVLVYTVKQGTAPNIAYMERALCSLHRGDWVRAVEGLGYEMVGHS
jgi:hypothetical protein